MSPPASIDIREEAGVRYLHFGSEWIQGAMRIARPYALELDYTQEMMAALLLRDGDWPRRVLMIGLGAASLLKFLWRHRTDSRLDVVEISPQVVAAARQFFKLPEDPARIRLHVADAAEFVSVARGRYDLVLVDGFDADARAGRLDTVPFYLDCKARLAGDGLLVTNLLSRRKDFRMSIRRLEEAFDDQVVAFPSCVSGNAIAIATAGVPPGPTFEDLKDAARDLKRETGLNLLPTLARLTDTRHLRGGTLRFCAA